MVTFQRILHVVSVTLLVFSFLSFASIANAQTRTAPLIADHVAASQFDQIPPTYLDAARNLIRLSYRHTSHGSQITSGLQYWSTQNNALYQYPNNFYCDNCITGTSGQYPASDLGNPDRDNWAMATREYLNSTTGNTRNTILWSWCGQVSNASASDISNPYLANMAQLEADFPQVTFIYMTGHLDGTGPTGNLYQRNNQIRDYVNQNNKVLFDFADIESYDPDGNYYPTGSDNCAWCTNWCTNHPEQCIGLTGCAHSHGFNCAQKGKAFWWLMARLAGWPGVGVTPQPPPPTVTPSPSPTSSPYDLSNDGVVDIRDFLLLIMNFSHPGIGNFNQNGLVDIYDLNRLLQNL